MDSTEKRLFELKKSVAEAWEKLKLDEKLEQISVLEAETADPEIWKDPENAKAKNQALAALTSETDPWKILKSQADDLQDFIDISKTENEDMLDEISDQLSEMERTFETLKKALLFTGQFDNKNAILRITSGVGGTEAMDWAGMLERMYLRFFEQNNFKATLIERVAGEEAGIKTAVYEISGATANLSTEDSNTNFNGLNPYGVLKSEHGVHRLVRLSPFNADNLRQTSFALVEILPVIEEKDVEIDEKDLRIDIYRSHGHGGQGVNTTDSAVRITHLPTNIVVTIQNERSQHANKNTAMEILRGKLVQLQQEQEASSLAELRAGESAKWGQQIRNYVMQPYQLVKDTRTKYEETDVDAVLDGKINNFIDAYLEFLIGK